MSTSSRPYLLRAIYEWLLDNNLTPHLVIDTNVLGVEVPSSHIDEGQLVLNISPDACRHLLMGDDEVTFSARFSGVSRQIRLPVDAVTAIYARENSLGMVFGDEPRLAIEPSLVESNPLVEAPLVEVPKAKNKPALDTKTASKITSSKASHLKVIK
ncbi:MAG: ClpXP protease specificity-enhancing factor [Pseudomonadaceae bacterium]|nr:ClpXP protease specificity-enhancing factor [Pseudomonadaceae bacterium]